MLVPILLFIAGLILLIKGGDWFVDGACGIAKKFHVPDLLIGATIVSIGTTLPEVMVSASAAFKGSGEIAYGNAIGSIICNTALIAAVSITVKPTTAERGALTLPVIFFFVVAIFYSCVAYFIGTFTRAIGLILLAVFAVYIILSVRNAIKMPKLPESEENKTPMTKKELILNVVKLIVGAGCIAFGATLLVDNGIIIAKALGVPEVVIAITFVALGTSLPELVTAITSLIKGHGALSLGNIIGANLFNLILVSGVSIVVSPFNVPNSTQIAGINTSLLIDIPLMFVVMAILTIPTLIRQKLSRVQGVSLLALYVAFCTLQFVI